MDTLDKIRAEIAEERVHDDWDFGQEIYYNNAIEDVLKIIDKYRQKERNEDKISMEVNMCDCCKEIWNRENLIKFDFANDHKLFICPDCLKEITKEKTIKPELKAELNELEPTTKDNIAVDCISRQAAIDKFEKWLRADGYNRGELNMLKAVLYELRALPPVSPANGKDTNFVNTTKKNVIYSPVQMAMDYAVNATDFSASSDAISRQAAIDAAENTICGDTWEVDQVIEAIQKLPSAQPISTKTVQVDDLISRQAAIDALREAENHAFNSFYKGLKKAHKIIAELPSVSPARPTDDTWSIKDVAYFFEKHGLLEKHQNDKMDDIKEIKGFSSAYPSVCDFKLLTNKDGTWITIQDNVGTSVTVKISDLSDFICNKENEDAISRQTVLESIEDNASNGVYSHFVSYEDAQKFKDRIKALSPVTPIRPKGKWINQHVVYANATKDFKVCSGCRYEFSYDAETGVGITDANFCPNCGSCNGGESNG